MTEARDDYESVSGAMTPPRRSHDPASTPAFRAELRRRLATLRESTNARLLSSDTQLVSSRHHLLELQYAVAHETRALKLAGETPERVLHAVKEALREELSAAEMPARTTAMFMAEAVQWCIDAYFTPA